MDLLSTNIGVADTFAAFAVNSVGKWNIRIAATRKNAKIGTNAVVTKDVPENAIMVGIPAKNVGIANEEFKPYAVTDESEK